MVDINKLRVSSILPSHFEGRGAWRLRFPEYRHVKFGSALRHSEAPLIDIALRIGYQSDTAFSIAFKRASGKSPGRFRAHSRLDR